MKTHYRKNSFLPVTAALALLVNHATAVTGTWNVDANGLWSLDTNWASSVIADDLLSTATISAVIEGTYGFNKTSSGTLILTGNNTLSGSVSIFNGGKLIAGHNNAFGTATVTINNNGSTLELADGITLNNAITIAAQGNARASGAGAPPSRATSPSPKTSSATLRFVSPPVAP